VRTLQAILADSVSDRRFEMEIMGLFAAVALLLSAVGLYGVVSLVASQRTHEVGVRLALGARPVDIFRMILGGGLSLVIIGAAVGYGLSLALTRLLASLLFGVTSTDAVTFAATPVILLGVAVLACWVPARRAMRVDPNVALRGR
jgi:putative ABC transport system permease protein